MVTPVENRSKTLNKQNKALMSTISKHKRSNQNLIKYNCSINYIYKHYLFSIIFNTLFFSFETKFFINNRVLTCLKCEVHLKSEQNVLNIEDIIV